MRNIKRKILFTLFCGALLLTGGCGKKNADAAVAATTPAATTSAAEKAEDDSVEIETDYGTLYYPAEWSSYLKTEIIDGDDAAFVKFKAEVDQQEYLLFDIEIGSGFGDYCGTITDAQGNKHDVFVVIETLPDLTALSQDQQDMIYAMQEDNEYVIAHLDSDK
jgi:hypothetical protein